MGIKEKALKRIINYRKPMATLGMNVNVESNTIVERCMNKMARDITVQIKEKLADIIIAKLQQKYLFDLDEARRFIMDELPSEVDVQKTQRVKKPVELDAEGNPIKKTKTPKEPKAPKEPKEPKEEKPKHFNWAWCGKRIEGCCEALRLNHGLYTQCMNEKTEGNAFCSTCEKNGQKFGTVEQRESVSPMEFVSPSGKHVERLINVFEKLKLDIDRTKLEEEAAKDEMVIPEENFEKVVKARGRPKKSVSTADTTPNESSNESDGEERPKVTKKTPAKEGEAAAPKRRGRPAKPKTEEIVNATEDVIATLVEKANNSGSKAVKKTKKAAKEEAKPVENAEELEEIQPIEIVEELAKPVEKTKKVSKKAKADEEAKAAAQKKKKVPKGFVRIIYKGVSYLMREDDEDHVCYNEETREAVGTWDEENEVMVDLPEDCDDETEDEN